MMRFRWVVIILGVALALVAIRLDDRRVAWVALVVLGLALALRFVMPRQRSGKADRDGPSGPSGDDSSAST